MLGLYKFLLAAEITAFISNLDLSLNLSPEYQQQMCLRDINSFMQSEQYCYRGEGGGAIGPRGALLAHARLGFRGLGLLV